MVTILRVALLYKPLRFFSVLALAVGLPGLAAILRFVYFYLTGDGSGHIQSLAVAAGLVSVAAIIAIGGLLADLVAANRVLLEEIRARQLAASLETPVGNAQRDLLARLPWPMGSGIVHVERAEPKRTPVRRSKSA
jgi:hypothetical protein